MSFEVGQRWRWEPVSVDETPEAGAIVELAFPLADPDRWQVRDVATGVTFSVHVLELTGQV